VAEHLAARLVTQALPGPGTGTRKDCILSTLGSAMARVMSEIEDSIGSAARSPAGPAAAPI
jgi:hypothetical protein